MNNILERYKYQFSNLHRAKIKGEKAPHKIILLLAIIDYVAEIMAQGDSGREHLLKSPITFQPSLEHFFFKEWSSNVRSKIFKPSYENPLIHMEYELFYHLVPKIDEHTLQPIPFIGSHSFSSINKSYSGIRLTDDLVILLLDESNRSELRNYLLELL